MSTASFRSLSLALALCTAAACSRSTMSSGTGAPTPSVTMSGMDPQHDPRVGLKAGLWDAGQAAWNIKLVSNTRPTEKFLGSTMSDLAFLGNYVIQGSYNGYQVWDVSNPMSPTLKVAYFCPASQSDVSVYKNLLFVSAEAASARLDCGAEGVKEAVSHERIRGIRIFDVSDITAPKYIGNVQTCRGSHTHTVLADPKDPENVYVYISGSAGVRSDQELPGCKDLGAANDPNSAKFRIEVIKVPLAHPEQAAIVSSPRIFNDLAAPARHGEAPEDIVAAKKAAADARAQNKFVVEFQGNTFILPDNFAKGMLDSVVKARNGTGAATLADSTALRTALPDIIAKMFGASGPPTGPTQCHDITVYPWAGFAGGACGGYGLLLDIKNPAQPMRIAAVADSNFSYWHSATFNNDATKLLFSDEWGGGGAPKCRATDKKEWGADAIFTIENGQLKFQSYYKMPAAQTAQENCVAHNGSLIPIPGRDVMVQGWYQGGISVFDWTDAAHPKEIAFFDRGPVDSTRLQMGGSWSVYYYNGEIISSEIARGLDVFELQPSQYLSKNEIDAAKTVHLDYLNTQGQPHFTWPASFVLARAYVDQLERSKGLSASRVSSVRQSLDNAEKASGSARTSALTQLATQLDSDASGSSDAAKVRTLATTVRDLAR
jgi:LVIVD repeat-containing protein